MMDIKTPCVTAVVRTSPDEDGVLEIYAEDLDCETVEWIDSFTAATEVGRR